VRAVSWASSGDISDDTQPSTPPIRSQIGRNKIGGPGQIVQRQLEEQFLARPSQFLDQSQGRAIGEIVPPSVVDLTSWAQPRDYFGRHHPFDHRGARAAARIATRAVRW
jgi:hypothetical protein